MKNNNYSRLWTRSVQPADEIDRISLDETKRRCRLLIGRLSREFLRAIACQPAYRSTAAFETECVTSSSERLKLFRRGVRRASRFTSARAPRCAEFSALCRAPFADRNRDYDSRNVSLETLYRRARISTRTKHHGARNNEWINANLISAICAARAGNVSARERGASAGRRGLLPAKFRRG